MEHFIQNLGNLLAASVSDIPVFTERMISNAPAPYYLVRLLQREMKRELGDLYFVQDTVEVRFQPKHSFDAALSEQMTILTEVLRKKELECSPGSLQGQCTEEAVTLSFRVTYRARLEKPTEELIAGSKITIKTGETI